MTPYYAKQLERGLQFQDFVGEILWGVGIGTVGYSSKLFQQRIGENKAKIEVKFDDRLSETGNLYMETAEKSDPKNGAYILSGIYRDCVEYVIGDYDVIYRFSTNILRAMHARKVYREIEIPLKTSKGFLMPAEKAAAIATQVLRPSVGAEVAEIIASQGKLDRDSAAALVRQMQTPEGQGEFW